MADVLGTPSIVSEVLSGKRELNKDHIKRLSRRSYVSPELFFQISIERPPSPVICGEGEKTLLPLLSCSPCLQHLPHD